MFKRLITKLWYKKASKEAIAILEKEIASNEPRSHGICFALRGVLTNREVHFLMADWPEHSGNAMYPVPHPTLHPRHAYDMCPNEDMWDAAKPYGNARIQLALHMIAKMKGRKS